MDAETVQIGILASQAVLLALFGYLSARIRSVRKDVKLTRHQVVNDHPAAPNMRDEFDSRHRENRRALRWIGFTLVKVMADVEALKTGYNSNRRRIGQLEESRRGRREAGKSTPTPLVVSVTDIPDDAPMPWEEDESPF